MSRHAIVIGAGVAGLATAVALRDVGWSVEVHERAGGLPSGGTALGMWPEAMDALLRLGVDEPIRRFAAHSRGASILDPRGAVVGRIPARRSAHLVSRERLLSALLDRLPSDAVHWAHPVTAPEDLPATDLVVGADGIRSRVRAQYWGRGAERALGTVAFRGVLDRPADSVTETWGPGALFGLTPMDGRRTNWFACLRRGRAGDPGDDAVPVLRHAFSAWHPAVRTVVEEVEEVDVDRRELFDVSIPDRWVRGRVALVGDAAHAMAPNLGRGACESLLDAVSLARALDAEPDVRSGLLLYDRHRRPRGRRVVRAARMLNRVATAERATRVRDAAVRLLMR
ncbi:FAD-dependent monooxygenase [Microbacterium sp. NPDC058345]|uniref:FAD-dependent monooxygenase n=1 Tax=Microbacterium sp. NPDC058345 TaxID=3346455 RepID=UPI00365CC505